MAASGLRSLVVLAIAALFAAGTVSAASAAEPKVAVTIKPIHALVLQLMDGIGKPTLIVDGASSPHTFALKPSAARAINEADIFIRVSEAVEPFTHKLVSALPPAVKVITLSEVPGVSRLDQREGGTFEKHVHDDHDHDAHEKVGNEEGAHDALDEHEAKDGHIWLDPENAKAAVAAIAAALGERYPEAREKIQSNAASLTAKLDALRDELTVALAPVKGKPFIIFHDATQYFENRFAVTAVGSITVSPDVQSSAKRLTQVRKKIVELGAVCVFAEPQFQPKLVAAVTEGTKARSGVLDAEGIAVTAGPEAYFEMMHSLARNLKGCLLPTS